MVIISYMTLISLFTWFCSNHISFQNIATFKISFFPELTCVPGWANDWSSYMSSWGTWISRGESTSNREECWRLAQQNVGNANGIYWDYDIGYCRALVDYQKVLPWPKSFPNHQDMTKLCLKTELVGKNERIRFYQY